MDWLQTDVMAIVGVGVNGSRGRDNNFIIDSVDNNEPLFGGAASLFGTIASAFSISQTQSTLEFFLSGSMAKVITLLTIVGILMVRPQGLFALKVRK